MIGGISSGLFWSNTPFQSTPISSTPSAIAAPVIVGRWVIRPMIRAASARTRKSSDSAEPIGRPIIPARRNSARKASTAAIAHTIVCRLFTGTPSRLARSDRSAAARMATPTAVRCRKSPMPRIAIGAIDQHEHVVGVEHQRIDLEGEVERRVDALRPHLLAERRGRSSPPNASSWVSPSVATVRIESRRAEEAADDQQLARGAERDRGGEPGAERDEPREPGGDDDHHRQRRRDVAEVGLGEVEDPVGAVHERHAHAHHRGEQADEHPAQGDARRDRERDHAGTAGSGRRGARVRPMRRARSSKGPPPSAPNPSLDIGSPVPPVCGGT